ncbi:MAG: NAD(P)-binding domain-containing protein [Cytophagales bacterium]|nr:NAD(P)-binding domain-containing protein [Cytophagales bacterium]
MKCLIVDEMHDSIGPLLESIGWEYDYQPGMGREDILRVIPAFEGLIIRSKTKVDRQLVSKARALKFIGRAGAGIDNLDVPVIEEAGIAILNAPEGNRNAVAEHTLGLVLGLLNNIVKSDDEIRHRKWDREDNRGLELAGKTVGLLGYGFMGMAVAEKLACLGCKVLAYDKYKKKCSDRFATQVDMEEIYKEADIFSIHVPLTMETKQLINTTYLGRFEKPIFLINTARGEIVDLEGLITSIEQGRVRAAALDVLENEKPAHMDGNQLITFNKLIKSEKIILTPHVAGWSLESYKKINEVLVGKIQAEINGNT